MFLRYQKNSDYCSRILSYTLSNRKRKRSLSILIVLGKTDLILWDCHRNRVVLLCKEMHNIINLEFVAFSNLINMC